MAGKPVMDEITKNLIAALTDDMRACMLAGCAIDTIIVKNTITLRTRYPVSILKDSKGKIIDVYEKQI